MLNFILFHKRDYTYVQYSFTYSVSLTFTFISITFYSNLVEKVEFPEFIFFVFRKDGAVFGQTSLIFFVHLRLTRNKIYGIDI